MKKKIFISAAILSIILGTATSLEELKIITHGLAYFIEIFSILLFFISIIHFENN
jgi:hypothetical protein